VALEDVIVCCLRHFVFIIFVEFWNFCSIGFSPLVLHTINYQLKINMLEINDLLKDQWFEKNLYTWNNYKIKINVSIYDLSY